MLREQYGGRRILEHPREALRWIREVDREIRCATLQNAQDSDHDLCRPLDADADDVATPNPVRRNQRVRNAIGSRIKFAIRPGALLE